MGPFAEFSPFHNFSLEIDFFMGPSWCLGQLYCLSQSMTLIAVLSYHEVTQTFPTLSSTQLAVAQTQICCVYVTIRYIEVYCQFFYCNNKTILSFFKGDISLN